MGSMSFQISLHVASLSKWFPVIALDSEIPRIASVDALFGSYSGQPSILGPASGSLERVSLTLISSFLSTFDEIRPGFHHIA